MSLAPGPPHLPAAPTRSWVFRQRRRPRKSTRPTSGKRCRRIPTREAKSGGPFNGRVPFSKIFFLGLGQVFLGLGDKSTQEGLGFVSKTQLLVCRHPLSFITIIICKRMPWLRLCWIWLKHISDRCFNHQKLTGSDDMFREVHWAFDLLSNAEKRVPCMKEVTVMGLEFNEPVSVFFG